MRVTMIATSYPRSAEDPSGHFVARTAEGLAARGVEVIVVAPHAKGSATSETLRGVDVRRFRYAPESMERVAYGPGILSNIKSDPVAALMFPAFLISLRRATARAARDADLLHAHWAQTALAAGADSGDKPLVITVHGSDLQLGRSERLRWTLERPLRAARSVMAVSADLAEQLQPYMPEGRTAEVVHGGVDGALLDLPTAGGSDGHKARILFVGRLVPEKGVHELVTALARIRTGFTLEIVGVGPEREAMRRQLVGASLDHAAKFLGALPHAEVLELMRQADLVVMPSHREGCGLVPIEAAAVGTPAVVTRTGAMPEVVGCPEAIVEPRDVDGLTAAIRLFVEDPTLRERCAQISRTKVGESFTWDRIADQTLGIYERVIGERKRPRANGPESSS